MTLIFVLGVTTGLGLAGCMMWLKSNKPRTSYLISKPRNLK